ncbi:DNA polymerase III subunit alpha [Neolewinella agarilytica]|uniref:DNA polymerase III subunit alpha n=1 Tax=Neolewinella agarilytica TaxID=478744 RepID=A0A1H9NED8_9BACT|nr:DNA polymerase III subunit alpha [Neolewinella agarilytica]SER34127.1 DNA polymerase III, alpha subunit [Neolewinella agarilytica]
MPEFCHLHCHTQYSLLDGASEIGTMMDKAVADGMKGVALTDHGNMFGAFKFVNEARKRNIKPMIGCEFYLVEDRHKKAFSRAAGEKDKRYHQLMLAKNKKGYQNLCKLCSIGYIEGLYGKYPRIDKELIEKYHEGLIVTSCCIGAEIPQLLIAGKDEEAEEALKWWLNIFEDDYYIEIQRHRGIDDIDLGKDREGRTIYSGKSQEDINVKLMALAMKHNVKVICTNDSHYVEEEDYQPHDLLLCVNTGSLKEDPKRFSFPSSDFYFKKQIEMANLFHDHPESVANTMEVYDKIEVLTLAQDVLLPNFPMPPEFATQDDYLRHLTYEGARKRYGEINEVTRERLDFELDVIKASGYPGYFLIVQDFTTAAREMGVSVGPGRGSAAGSAVAYCVGITNVDPIKYDLLFERFLNPERVSMPDIDIDFDDVGRQKVIDYVIDKYGQEQVAQIITYGTMAAKSSLRDVGRVMDVPLSEVDRVAKSFPQQLGASLRDVLADGDISPKLKGKMNGEDVDKAYAFRELAEQPDQIGEMIRMAKKLEGSIRNTGIHACGVVITPDDVTDYVPVTADKDTGMYVSQFDNSVAEDAGLLKMDFLGLKTLTIIKDALRMIKENHGVDIDVDELPLDDEKTYELFQRGETNGIFQYESGGMQKHMKNLKPTTFDDLIAMNALYRPGPLEYIPEFIERKHGRKPIVYTLDAEEQYLKETFGIYVYQEQIMLLSQSIANFSKGQADVLRKAMGKKKKDVLDKMYPKFVEGGTANGHPEEKLGKIWKDWEAFASYAFNKSHSTCYALVAYHTAYLKAHYPAEYMASVLTHNKSDQGKMSFFLRECKRMDVPVLQPDINESQADFSVNKDGAIRIGMTALKGVGEGPVEAILDARKEGDFESVFDMLLRIEPGSVNKRVLEALVDAGGFDCFEDMHRAQYYAPTDKFDSYLEDAVKTANGTLARQAEAASSLFAEVQDEIAVEPPKAPDAKPYLLPEKLAREKDVTGIYVSGHPLDGYKLEIDNYVTCGLADLDPRKYGRSTVKLAGMIVGARHLVSKNGNGWGIFELGDYDDTIEFKLFGDDYLKFKHVLIQGTALFLTATFQKKWQSEELELKISEIKLLEGVGEELTKAIILKMPLEELTTAKVVALDELCQRFQGDAKLRMVFYDREQDSKLKMFSLKRMVLADTDFVKEIEKMGIKYRLEGA